MHIIAARSRRPATLGVLALLLVSTLLLPATTAAAFGGASVLSFSGAGGGIANTGFTAVLPGTNAPLADRLNLDTQRGELTITATPGALDAAAKQDNALAVLFDGRASYSAIARINRPFPGTDGSAGAFIGANDRTNARLVLRRFSEASSVVFVVTVDGTKTVDISSAIPATDLNAANSVDLALTVQTSGNTLTAQYRLNGASNSAWRLAKQTPLPATLRSNSFYGGILATQLGGQAATPFQAVYDSFKVVEPIQEDTTPGPTISFNRETIFAKGILAGGSDPDFERPTVMTFGPDGRLYVGLQNGRIFALTLDINKHVTSRQGISTIYDIPNTNDNGTPSSLIGRLVLGIAFDPASTAERPIMYVTHSDVRTAESQRSINTRSGTVTRLVGPNYGASDRVDVVTGLPRSRANHAINGLAWGPDGWLYIAVAGNTNAGAASTYFYDLPEAYLSASIVRANVTSPQFGTRDLKNVNAAADMAPLAGLVELYATGFRNPFDLVWHSNNKLYVNVNAGNKGAGETPDSSCPNGQALDAGDRSDMLFLVTPGLYGGHPNPSRGECIFGDGTIYTPDKAPSANYGASIYNYGRGSYDGIAEYRASTFNGALRGNLLVVTYREARSLQRLVLSADGKSIAERYTLASFVAPIDVITTNDGAIIVADIGSNTLELLTPNSLSTCPLIGDQATVDSDGDGYTDEDESDAHTDLCSAGSSPRDTDGDGVSDIRDPDDDNDNRADVDDSFPYDPSDGSATVLPIAFEWNPGDEELPGYQNSGFTGTQISANGTRELPERLTVGVAGGFLAIQATSGTNSGMANNHSNVLQIGFNATQPFTITTSVPDPFASGAPVGDQAGGLFFGIDQDNYLKLVLGADSSTGTTGIQFAVESAGVLVRNPTTRNPQIALPGPQTVDLVLVGNPAAGTLQALYRVNGADPAQFTPIGTLSANDYPVLQTLFRTGAAAGLLATNSGGSGTLNYGFDYFRVSSSPDVEPPVVVERTPAPGVINVAESGTVTAKFSEPVVSVSSTTFTLALRDGTPVAAVVSYDAATQTATLDPVADLLPGTVYTVALLDGIADSAQNPLAPVGWSFTTRVAATTQTYTLHLPVVGSAVTR